jgi:hypothetical protein
MKRLSLAFTLIFSACVIPVAHAATLLVDQGRVYTGIAAGGVETGQIHLTNPTDESTSVKVYVEDWVYKQEGTGDKDFFPAGTLPNSASKWITLSPVEFVLPPYGEETIHYTITAPAGNLSGGYYSVIFFETILGTTQNEEGANVLVSGRIGTLMYMTINGTEKRSARIDALEIRPPGGSKPAEFDVTLTNDGNIALNTEGEFLIMDAQGLVKGRGPMTQTYLHPGATAKRTTAWTGTLPPGTYDVIVTIDLGEGSVAVKEAKMPVR